MENLIQVAGPAEVRAERRSWRALTIFAAIALVLGGIVLTRADSSRPASEVVTNIENGTAEIDGVGSAVARTLGFGAQAQPQIDVGALIRAIVCPILNALASGPFGGFIGPVIGSLRAAFGCVSPG